MGIINLKKAGSDAPPPETPGREDLRFWHRELAGALSAEIEGVALVSSLRAAIETGQRAEASAVAGLVAGRGQALPNAGELSEKIVHGELAKKALPTAEEKLKTSAGEVTRLRAAVVKAARQQLIADAGVVVSEYDRKLAEVHAIYDQLCGVRGALTGEAGMRPIEAPRFRLVVGSEIGMDVHGPLGLTGDARHSTLKATADWTRALDRLIESPNADLSDLTGPAQ